MFRVAFLCGRKGTLVLTFVFRVCSEVIRRKDHVICSGIRGISRYMCVARNKRIWYVLVWPVQLACHRLNKCAHSALKISKDKMFVTGGKHWTNGRCGRTGRELALLFRIVCQAVFGPHGGSPRAHRHVVRTLRFMSDINQPSLPTPFYSLLVSISVFMAISIVFHSINYPDNSPFSHSVLPVLALLYRSFQLHTFLWKSPSVLIWSFVVDRA